MDPKRIALGIRYDGNGYHGWQIQKELVSIQETLEQALGVVANHSVSTTCAGRTDAGVHATAQVVHFDTHVTRSEHAWKAGANSNLPEDIRVVWAKEVRADFHARFSAKARRYRYVLYNQDVRPGILRNAVGWWYRELDVEKMQEGANFLLGQHDFSSFRGGGCQSRSPWREIFQLEVRRVRHMVIIEVLGNAFLLHMVRNIAGVLIAIGSGDEPPIWAEQVLMARDRKQGGVTISPAGLYLVDVEYPAEFELPRMPLGPFFL